MRGIHLMRLGKATSAGGMRLTVVDQDWKFGVDKSVIDNKRA